MKNFIKNHQYILICIIIALLIIFWLGLINEGEYGAVLFFAIPISIGFIIGYAQKFNKNKEHKIKKVIKGFVKILLVLAALAIILIVIGLEGAICILMAYPFILIPMFIAYMIGQYIGEKDGKNKINAHAFLVLLLLNPTTYIYDHYTTPIQDNVQTELIVNISHEEIWKQLTTEINFENTSNFLFKSGVSYPKSIKLLKTDKGFSYKCNTNNDTIQLNIIEYISKKKVKFKLDKQTIPMKELSPYDSINAKHLHNYFIVNYGEITLDSLTKNTTKITAKTSYSYKIAPKWYWKLWSNYIIDEMQLHVLKSIESKNNE